jgi:hypothetical protein
VSVVSGDGTFSHVNVLSLSAVYLMASLYWVCHRTALCVPGGGGGPWSLLSRSCSASIVTRLRARRPGFDFRQEQVFFHLPHRFQIGSGIHPSPLHLIPWSLPGGKAGPGREVHHSYSWVNDEWSYTSAPHTSS